MAWVEVFAVFVVCHCAGDFLLQTNHQALNKQRGLGADRVRRRALGAHIATYGLAFLPAFVWIALEQSVLWAAVAAVAVLVPHAVQDDGRLLIAYQERVKRLHDPPPGLRMMIDQAGHIVALFLAGLLASL